MKQKQLILALADTERACIICGDIFDINSQPTKKTCSVKCGRSYSRNKARGKAAEKWQTKQCKNCNVSLNINNIKNNNYKNLPFCSDKCYESYYLRKCSTCKKEFISQSAKKEVYCDIKCNPQYCKMCEKIWYGPTKNTYCEECRKGLLKKKCKECNQIFEIKTNNYSQKYCSAKCRYQRQLKNIKTKTYPNKSYGIKDEIESMVRLKVNELIKLVRSKGNLKFDCPIDYRQICFTDKQKEKALSRDDLCCQICKKNTNLQVHHKIKRKNGGSHELDNLITLCVSCHRAIESGNESHAIRKCTLNAFKHRNISYTKEHHKLNRFARNEILKKDLKNAFKFIVREEYEEASMTIDNLIELLESI